MMLHNSLAPTATNYIWIVVLSFILILELTTKRRRGLFIGMVNAGFTTGITLGAVVFGALISSTGWVSLPDPIEPPSSLRTRIFQNYETTAILVWSVDADPIA